MADRPMPKPKTPDPALPNEAGKLPRDMPTRTCPTCGNPMPLRAPPDTTCRPCRRRHSDGVEEPGQ